MKTECSRRIGVLALSGALGVLLGGCSTMQKVEDAGSKPVPYGDALHQLELDLSRVSVVVPSNVLVDPNPADPNSWKTDPHVGQIKTLLAEDQCYSVDPKDGKVKPELRTRNPLIPVMTGPLQLTVQGQLSEGGTLTISVTPSVAGTATRQTQQQVMVPLTLVSLTTLPTFYMGQQMSNIQNVTVFKDFKSDDANEAARQQKQIASHVAAILKATARLGILAQEALDGFDHNAKYCDGKETSGWSSVAPAAAPPGAPPPAPPR